MVRADGISMIQGNHCCLSGPQLDAPFRGRDEQNYSPRLTCCDVGKPSSREPGSVDLGSHPGRSCRKEGQTEYSASPRPTIIAGRDKFMASRVASGGTDPRSPTYNLLSAEMDAPCTINYRRHCPERNLTLLGRLRDIADSDASARAGSSATSVFRPRSLVGWKRTPW